MAAIVVGYQVVGVQGASRISDSRGVSTPMQSDDHVGGLVNTTKGSHDSMRVASLPNTQNVVFWPRGMDMKAVIYG